MRRKSFAQLVLSLAFLLTLADRREVAAANMRSFIEAVRRKAPVVYVASVREVRLLSRTHFDIKERAVVDVLAVMRGRGTKPSQATIGYSSYDDKTSMLAGGPQYQLRPGVMVVVFANSFATTIPPGYLLHGTRGELLKRIEALRDALGHMSPDQLKMHEIDDEDRYVQLEMYDKLASYLRASK